MSFIYLLYAIYMVIYSFICKSTLCGIAAYVSAIPLIFIFEDLLLNPNYFLVLIFIIIIIQSIIIYFIGLAVERQFLNQNKSRRYAFTISLIYFSLLVISYFRISPGTTFLLSLPTSFFSFLISYLFLGEVSGSIYNLLTIATIVINTSLIYFIIYKLKDKKFKQS